MLRKLSEIVHARHESRPEYSRVGSTEGLQISCTFLSDKYTISGKSWARVLRKVFLIRGNPALAKFCRLINKCYSLPFKGVASITPGDGRRCDNLL
jgi:hypothetical protein